MERVFAKYEKFKDLMEELFQEKNDNIRKLFAEGALHFFDAESPNDEDSSPGHRLNVGIYRDFRNVIHHGSLNTVYMDINLPKNFLKSQVRFFTCSSGVMLDVAFALNKDRFNQLKRNIIGLKGIENVLKKVHSEHVPVRKHQFKNVKFFSKYLVGDSLGGDYFDVEEIDRRAYFFLTSFNSYVSSVNFIKNMTSLKDKRGDVFNEVNEFVSANIDEIKGLFFLDIDLRKLDARYIKIGDILLSGNLETCNSQVGNVKLQPGDSITIGSTGFKKLTEGFNPNTGVCETEKDLIDLYNDYFSFLNSKKSGRFLKEDASLIVLKVNQNTIQEVKE